MNAQLLARALRAQADIVCEALLPPDDIANPARESLAGNAGELIRCAARLIEGKTIERAFGAPGDWGYGTPIGDALAAQPEAA